MSSVNARFDVTVEFSVRTHTSYGTGDPVVHFQMKETVPEGVDPCEYMRSSFHKALGRKLDDERHVLKALEHVEEGREEDL